MTLDDRAVPDDVGATFVAGVEQLIVLVDVVVAVEVEVALGPFERFVESETKTVVPVAPASEDLVEIVVDTVFDIVVDYDNDSAVEDERYY